VIAGPDSGQTGRLVGRASVAGRLRAASSSTTETPGKSARAKLSCAGASSGASTPLRSIGGAAMSLGASGSAGNPATAGPSRQAPPRPPRPEPRFDIRLAVAFTQGCALGHALIFLLALARRARFEALEPVEPPIKHLHRRAAEPAAGPDEFERREQSPRVVALDDGFGENIARHGGGVYAMTAEGARQPNAWRKLADLRHAMQRIAEHPGPGVLDLDLAELRIDRRHVGLEPPHIVLGIGLPRGRVSRPEQPVVADDAVVIVGKVGIR